MTNKLEDRPSGQKPKSGQYLVLYVEDNPANLRLMQQIIRLREDLKLIHAASGQMAIDMVEQENPDLILMDINLPDIDGFSALFILKDNESTKDIPVIAVTANAMPDDVQRGKDAGFFDYITKPVELDRLLESVDKGIRSLEQ
ncbi:MAG: response regulator [Gammaproteobacteria bacterium]|nr:response regulator [Gammaproteobacteria bacterium]MDH5799331.1 response regulator [Gammaproteobacteria bacterium]